MLDLFKEIERMLGFKSHDKERERSNHATQIAATSQGTRRICPMQHNKMAWTGPPHDIRAYICIICGAVASEPEIVDRGWDFTTVLFEHIQEIMDADLQRQIGNAKSFAVR